jgi:MOB kinase activator 1
VSLGDLRRLVALQDGEDVNECLARNVTYLHHQLDLIWGMISEFCTPDNCPQMTAGQGYKYLWPSENPAAPPVQLTAPDYIKRLLGWVEGLLADESTFPGIPGAPFPDDFQDIVRNIMKRLFRIYAHCYYHHAENFQSLSVMEMLDSCFNYFVLFTNQFDLIDADQLDPLRDQIDQILRA